MNWEDRVLSTPVDMWIVDQVVVLDWHDGPRSGFCALARPAVDFEFEFVDEEHNPDGLDLRIVRLKELPTGSVHQLALELQHSLGVGPVARPVWCPVWKFPSETARQEAERNVETLQRQARVTNLLVATSDMEHIAKCWKAHTTAEALS